METVIRAARTSDGAAVFEVTRRSVAALAKGHYTAGQIAGWMGDRTPAYYESAIANGRMFLAEREGKVIGFVYADPGEVKRLFLLPEAAGAGLGARLLQLGVRMAAMGHDGPVVIEATLNAEAFYRRNGFVRVVTGFSSHRGAGAPIEIVHMELQE